MPDITKPDTDDCVMAKADKPLVNYDDATISRDALLTAYHQAAAVASDTEQRLTRAERQRDAHVRQAGGLQERIDRLRAEQQAVNRHVRNLSALL